MFCLFYNIGRSELDLEDFFPNPQPLCLCSCRHLHVPFEPRHEKTCLRGSVARYDSNRPAQLQRLATVIKFLI